MRPVTIQLFFFDAGGGHRSAMKSVTEVLRIKRPHWKVVAINLQELLQPVDPIFLATRVKSENVYNAALRKGWTRNSSALLRTMQAAIRLNSPTLERPLVRHWRGGRPDLVVSLIPNFNGVMFRALRQLDAATPYLTVMTDIADLPPHFWQEPQDQYLVCGSSKAYLQARLSGWYRCERVVKTSGMLLSPSFYAPAGSPVMTREDLGLREDLTTALIMFGGNGSAQVPTILDQIEACGLPLQSIVLCGRNEEQLRQLAARPRCHAVGFTDRVADYMRLADVFIGKPGPGSISEALQMRLPVIVENNSRTLIQERYNAVWIEEQGLGLALDSFDNLGHALDYLLTGNVLADCKMRVSAIENRAIFELPEIFDGVLRDAWGDGILRMLAPNELGKCFGRDDYTGSFRGVVRKRRA